MYLQIKLPYLNLVHFLIPEFGIRKDEICDQFSSLKFSDSLTLLKITLDSLF